jgi:DNA invertase Pin-like site-specific DNA recombinase
MSYTPRLRCAVYTRKSTDEGLDQEFNSLDAQREACVAYIASQVGLGWNLVPDLYDDGGISGGTMDRPALQRLLQDIRDKRVDVVVVYKIDRLTRSLADFSKIVEIFDAGGVSFVSVTQQFNTTTSMGRLTLNVLLSFAQFEREVTAERIRDKIAASKKKGMWMGGIVPLGYRAENRKLLINECEVRTVRHLFERYLVLKSVRSLADEASACGLQGRVANGSASSQGKPFGRGNLYHLLSNPIYIGKIRHRDQLYHGEHKPIIDMATFEAAQSILAGQAPARRTKTNNPDIHLLTGIVFDDSGDRLSPSHVSKGGKRYRYYISKRLTEAHRKGSDGWRVPAIPLESRVEQQLASILNHKAQLAEWIQQSGSLDRIKAALAEAERLAGHYRYESMANKRDLLQRVFRRVELASGQLILEVDRQAIIDLILPDQQNAAASRRSDDGLPSHRIAIPIAIKRRGVETRMVLADNRSPTTDPDPALIQLIARAHLYLARLTSGSVTSLTEIAAACRTELSEVSRILPLAFLAPSIVDAIMTGCQSPSLTAQRLLRLSELPMLWRDQAKLLAK